MGVEGGSQAAGCSSTCAELAADEWLANTCCGLWSSEGGVLTALRDTWLKKSTANSWDLPEAMVLAAKTGTRCRLLQDGQQVGDYAMCSPESSVQISLV